MKDASEQRTILVVDDKPANLLAAHNVLKAAYIVKVATNGASALALAEADPQPDLILLDIMMPGMDGYQVCAQLKADPHTCDIPVIFLTGMTGDENEKKGFKVGAIDYIHKPFSPGVLEARVRTHLALREARELWQDEKRRVDSLLFESERVSKLIFGYTAQMGAEADPAKLLRLNADMARDLIQADRCTVWSCGDTPGELWTEAAHGLPKIRISADHGLVGACVTTNEVIVVNDTSVDPRFDSEIDRSTGYTTRSLLTAPLRSANGKVMGALQLVNKPSGFTERDIRLLALASSFTASALIAQKLRHEAEVARLLFRELEIAREVQRCLFPPHPPRIPGLDIAAFCRPAHAVGGDYYDLLYRPDSDLWLTVGDVSGKGISAAVLMASLQASLRAQLNGQPSSVADVVSELNQAICSSFGQERYTTLFCGRLNPADWNFTYVNAGHVRPRLLRASGEMEHLDCGGVPVGLIDSAAYEHASTRLHPGDLLACFSDGVTEATNRDEEIWDGSEVDTILRENQHSSAAELVEKLVKAVDTYMGGAEQADDLTVLILRVL